ncbi:MAG TPA: zinc-binding dehydrogenase [Gemmatimonadales bacterium]|nr:zinc-binding dehydrogenase [Gemmatimonadales bacterium]
MMQAAVLEAPQHFALRPTAIPEPGMGEVRIRIEGSGVCASSVPLWQGREWFQYPQANGMPGHEGWGHIEALGENVTGLSVGQRVAAVSNRAFAEYDITPADAVVPLPDALDDVPFPGEPFGCAFNIFARADIRPGHTVAIIGIGFIGAVLTRLVSSAGARVIALSRRNSSLNMARQMGALDRVSLRKGDRVSVIKRVHHLTNGRLCERVIECVGAQEALDLAGELTAERGKLIIAGFHQDGSRQVNMFLWNWRGLDVVNAHERDSAAYVQGIRAAANALAAGVLDPLPLLTHRYPLAKLNEAFRTTVERPDGFVKAVVFA